MRANELEGVKKYKGANKINVLYGQNSTECTAKAWGRKWKRFVSVNLHFVMMVMMMIVITTTIWTITTTTTMVMVVMMMNVHFNIWGKCPLYILLNRSNCN